MGGIPTGSKVSRGYVRTIDLIIKFRIGHWQSLSGVERLVARHPRVMKVRCAGGAVWNDVPLIRPFVSEIYLIVGRECVAIFCIPSLNMPSRNILHFHSTSATALAIVTLRDLAHIGRIAEAATVRG